MIESGKPLPPKTVLLEAKLVVRQSSMGDAWRAAGKTGRN